MRAEATVLIGGSRAGAALCALAGIVGVVWTEVDAGCYRMSCAGLAGSHLVYRGGGISAAGSLFGLFLPEYLAQHRNQPRPTAAEATDEDDEEGPPHLPPQLPLWLRGEGP